MDGAAAILASPWLHWFAGIVIGFAGGVWLDFILRMRAVGVPLKTIPPRRKGFIDYSLDVVEEQRASLAVLGRVGNRMEWISRRLPSMTEKVQRIMLRYGPTQENPIPTRRFILKSRRAAADAARMYDKFSSQLDKDTDEYRRHVIAFVEAVKWLREHNPDWKTQQEFEATKLTKDIVAKAKEQTLSFAQSMREQHNVSADLADSVDRAVARLICWAEAIGILEEFCDEQLELFEEA